MICGARGTQNFIGLFLEPTKQRKQFPELRVLGTSSSTRALCWGVQYYVWCTI